MRRLARCLLPISGVSILLGACNPTPTPQPPPGSATYDLVVARHDRAILDGARAEDILEDATEVLQRNDGPADVSCDVTMQPDGPVTVFTIGNGVINSESGFMAVNDSPGNVKLVNAINWCGGPGVGIIGCAPVPGNSFVAVRFTGNQEGILWAHEFGHNKGLSHRTGDNLVMNPTIGETRRRINAEECTAYLGL